jgi:hypothetical protein
MRPVKKTRRPRETSLMAAAQPFTNRVTFKSMFGLSSAICLLAGCAATPQLAGTHSSSGGPLVASVAVSSASTQNDESYRTVYVAAPTGSLLGAGYVRVANEVTGNDANALLGTINQLNAASDTKEERPFVISSNSRAAGVSERELQAQQDFLRLQFGQLCAINTIARGDSNKVGQTASLKSKGKTRTDLAIPNGASISSVEQPTRNANTSAVTADSNAAERAHRDADRMKAWSLIRR